MFAVIKTGGKQYRVAADDVLKITRIEGEPGDIVQIGDVLAVGSGDDVTIGAPLVDGASVAAEVVEHGRSRKIIAFKKRRRQNSRRKRGQRELLTTVRISEILTGGAKPSKKAQGKPAAKTDDKASEAKADETKAAKPAKADAKPAAKAEDKPAKKAESKADDKKAADKGAADKGAEAKAATPLFKAPKGKADDLTEIKGIGPVAAKDLNEEGITTFAQLAKLTDDEVAKIDEHMPFSADQIKDWREQAKEMAK